MITKEKKNAQIHLKERGRWNRSFQMAAALLETGKKITGNEGAPVWETKDLQKADYGLD